MGVCCCCWLGWLGWLGWLWLGWLGWLGWLVVVVVVVVVVDDDVVVAVFFWGERGLKVDSFCNKQSFINNLAKIPLSCCFTWEKQHL